MCCSSLRELAIASLYSGLFMNNCIETVVLSLVTINPVCMNCIVTKFCSLAIAAVIGPFAEALSWKRTRTVVRVSC